MASFNLFGIPIKINWSVLFIIIYAVPFSQNMYAYPLVIGAYFLLILIHELGHAVLCMLLGYKIVSIDLQFIGGTCYYESISYFNAELYEFHHSIIAWGGVLFQIILFCFSFITLYYMEKIGISHNNIFHITIVSIFMILNILLIIINLIPIRRCDGYYALKIFKYFYYRITKYGQKKKSPIIINTKKQLKAKNIIDEIMKKISKDGWNSLTSKEKRKIKWARKHYKLEKIK